MELGFIAVSICICLHLKLLWDEELTHLTEECKQLKGAFEVCTQ